MYLVRSPPRILHDPIMARRLTNPCVYRCDLGKFMHDVFGRAIASESMSTSLKFLIKEHHGLFVQLYDKYIPKFHFLVHYPEQMLAVGPMTRTWTMRHEAKLNFFKRWVCYELSSGNLLYNPIECGPGIGPRKVCDEIPDIQEGLRKLMEISPDSSVFHPRWVRKDGITYKDDVFLITGYDGLDPIFSQLDELLVVGGDLIVFIVHSCTTLFFDSHYHAYAVENQSQRELYNKSN